MITREKLAKWFSTSKIPVDSDAKNDAPAQEIRLASKKLAETILDNTPPSADQSSAIRYVRQAYLWAVEAACEKQ